MRRELLWHNDPEWTKEENMSTQKILMLVGDYVEDYEVMVPFQTLMTI